MICYLLYTKNSPEERQVQDLAQQLQKSQVETKLVESDSAEGISISDLYDLTARPAVVLVRGDGSPIERWQDGHLPLATDISYLAHQG